MQTALAAGMCAVGALWGFRGKEELVKDGAQVLVEPQAHFAKAGVLSPSQASVVKGLARASVESVMIESTSMRSLWRMATLLAALVVSIWPVCGQVTDTTTNRFNEKTIRQWTLQGPLSNTPKHERQDLPLSDQSNRGGWAKFEPMWDEFDGFGLDINKWTVGMSWWRGRQPAWFNPTNVTVHEGHLQLTMRKEAVPRELENKGYRDYTSAALHTRARSSYGYYEVKARPMNSGGSSSFWFQQEDRAVHPDLATEIDVFEICGKSPTHDRRYYMTLHVTQTPQEKRHWQVGSYWEAPWRFAEEFHVYGFEWKKDELRWYVDGVLVRTVANTHWHQPLYLIFDSETMPEWFGMPNDNDLPSTYSIEYIRVWTRDETP